MPRPDLRTAIVGLMSALVGAHLFMVTTTALPTNPFTDAVRPHADYLSPYFTQNWRLFAPNPVDEDRGIRFQGSYVDAAGTARRTPWIDWTTVELDLVRHRLVGGRGGYVTTKFYAALNDKFYDLSLGQRRASEETSEVVPPSWATLDLVLTTAGFEDTTMYLRHDRAAIRLATDVLQARWPDRDFTSVRYAVREREVVPYADRHLDEAGRESARPPEVVRAGGWRVPTPGNAREREAIASFDRRHR